MNKILILLLVVATLAAGFFVGRAGKAKPTVIQVAATNETFKSQGSAQIAGNEGVVRSLRTRTSGEVILVKDGGSIQEAVTAAQPGAVIKIMPGVYRETVYIDKDDITLSGVIERGEYAVLEGEGFRNDAILYSGNGVTIENLYITHYKGNAIMGQAGNNFVIRNNVIVDTGVYGIFPQLGKNGIVSHNIVSGIEDAAIYIGMSDHVDVVFNQVFNSVAGIEIENSRHALVESNYVYNNTGGILAFVTPGLPIKTCGDVLIRNNFIVDNNHENFAIKGSMVANIPQGSGVIVMACDDVVIESNIISGNDSFGIVITDFDLVSSAATDPDSDPDPNRVKILDNIMRNNGTKPAAMVRAIAATQLMGSGPDIADTAQVGDACISHRERYRTWGVDEYSNCDIETTVNVASYTLSQPVPRRDMQGLDKGRLVYYGVCAGCHAYNSRMIGPPTKIVQALYMDDPQGIADYVASPQRKRDDYPEMPPQSHLDEETRLAVAKFMLAIEK